MMILKFYEEKLTPGRYRVSKFVQTKKMGSSFDFCFAIFDMMKISSMSDEPYLV